MSFPVLLDTLFNLALVGSRNTVCFRRCALAWLLFPLPVGFDGGEGGVGRKSVALSQAGFDFDDGVRG